MALKHFEIELPEEALVGFGWKDTEVPQRVREALVMDLVRLDKISEAEAAAFLGLNRWDLLETMGRYKVLAIWMSPKELQDELAREIKPGDPA